MRPFFRFHCQKVLAVEGHAAARHLIGGIPHQHIAQGALSRPVLPHEGMNFARIHRQVDAFQYLFAIDAGMQISYL